jgi:hypothetical protein
MGGAMVPTAERTDVTDVRDYDDGREDRYPLPKRGKMVMGNHDSGILAARGSGERF